MIRGVFFLVRFVLFLLLMVMWIAYGVLRFIAKPGARIIVPVALFAALWVSRDANNLVLQTAAHWLPGDWLANETLWPYVVLGLWLAFTLAWYVLSRIMALIVGTFPTFNRPLAPMRRLTTGKRRISSAAVRIAVPPLRMP